MKVLLFLWKHKILKDPANLSYQTKNFFHLSNKEQRTILDKYFKKFNHTEGLETYFDAKESRYYEEGREITFFHCYYFDKLLIEYRIDTIRLMDNFIIEKEKKDYLIKYALEKIKKDNIEVTARELIHYPDDLPSSLSEDIDFMKYLINQDESNIKYITYNEKCASAQRELIQEGIELAKKKPFNQRKFYKNNGELPKILETNLDFIIYLIQNNIENVSYLTDKILERTTITNKKIIIETIIESLKEKPNYMKEIQSNHILANLLNSEEDFIMYMLDQSIDNIHYIDWQHLSDTRRNILVDNITNKIVKENIQFDIMKYPSRNIFFQNYNFMKYLIKKDFRWIAITKINNKDQNNKLIDLFFQILETKKYHFRLEDFLGDGEYINNRLIENTKMMHYFFENKVPVIKYINFFDLTSSKEVVENILKEIEKKDYEFNNNDFLVNGKYPIPLSNSYRFMRYVIDKNFNHLAYIDISMIDKNELKRIINYAFRMVYYIRGNNKNLNFDIEGYFKNAPILEDEYFKECQESL